MENKEIFLIALAILAVLFVFGGGLGMMNYGYGYGMMGGFYGFGWIFMIIVLVATVLLIIWLLENIDFGRRRRQR